MIAFPAGRAPGFNQHHVALSHLGCRYSCIAVRGNILSLLPGAPGVMTGSFTNKMDGKVGPAVFANSNNQSRISGLRVINPTNGAVAAIIAYDGSITGNKGFMNSLTCTPFITNTLKVFWIPAVTTMPDTGFVLTGNRFYFILMSWASSNRFRTLVVDLTTGVTSYIDQDLSGFATATEAATDDILFGNAGSTVAYTLAAIAYTYKFMNEKEMRAWGNDPWGFWYPK